MVDQDGSPAPGADVLSTTWARPARRRRPHAIEPAVPDVPPEPLPPLAESPPLVGSPALVESPTLVGSPTLVESPTLVGSGPLPAVGRPPSSRDRRVQPLLGPVRQWAQLRRQRLLLVAALLAGAVLGGGAVHGWEADRAERARRDTIQLSARVAEDSPGWTGTRQPWTLRVVLTNSGPTDIQVQDGRLADNRFESKLRPVSVGSRIKAGGETWLSLNVTHSCTDGGPAPAPRALALTVTPSGRPARKLTVRLADDGARLVDTARQKCLTPDAELWATAELAGQPTSVGSALAVPIRIRLVGAVALAVREIRTSTPGLSVVAALPVRFDNRGITSTTTLRWSIADCERAKVVNYSEVTITSTVMLADDGQALRLPTVLDANGVLAVGRYIIGNCE